MCENEHFLCRFVRDCNDFLVWGFWRWVCIFLKCFAAGWGTKIGFAHLVPLPAGVTENKES